MKKYTMWQYVSLCQYLATQLSRISLLAVSLRFPFTGTKWPSPNSLQHKRSMKKWLAKVDVKELEWPGQNTDLDPSKHL